MARKIEQKPEPVIEVAAKEVTIEKYVVDTKARRHKGFVPVKVERRPGVFVTCQVSERLLKLADDLDLVAADEKCQHFERKHAELGAKMIRTGVPFDAPQPDGNPSFAMWSFYNAMVVRRERRIKLEARLAETA